MASPWNPDYIDEFNRRMFMMQKLRGNDELLALTKIHYANDCAQWINDWCITYNPRNKDDLPKTLPFILFERQKQFVEFILECWEAGESGLVEKCRDIGATWLCCAISVWMWLYVPGASIGWGSRKEQMVDKLGDPDSIFQKLRLIINHLPEFLLPEGFDIKKHMSYMKIINPENGSVITGEAGDNIGRGGRSSIYFKDESAHYERPELIEAALGDNTDVQIDISSVNGSNNVFYRRRMSGEIWEPGKVIERGKTRVFIFDWRDHPLKDQDWYDRRRKKAEDDGLLHLLAQEVDRDYSASLDRIIIPAAWVRAAIDAHIKLNFDGTGARRAALDVADEGGDKNALTASCGVILGYAEHWGEGDTGETARKAVSTCGEFGIFELYYDCIGVGAGVKAETNRLASEGALPPKLHIHPWNAAAAPLDPEENIILGDPNTPKNEDYFANLKAQAWWRLRWRFEKTYKAVTQGASYPEEEMISIPSDLPKREELVMELSQATQKINGKGKILVDKKPNDARSPNLADSVVMLYTPVKEVSIFDVL